MNRWIRRLLLLLILLLAFLVYLLYRQNPSEINRKLSEAQSAMEAGHWQEAYDRFSSILLEDQAQPEALYGKFIAALDLRQEEEAARIFDQLQPELRQKQDLSVYQRMVSLAHQLNLPSWKQLLEEGLKQFPADKVLQEMAEGRFPLFQQGQFALPKKEPEERVNVEALSRLANGSEAVQLGETVYMSLYESQYLASLPLPGNGKVQRPQLLLNMAVSDLNAWGNQLIYATRTDGGQIEAYEPESGRRLLLHSGAADQLLRVGDQLYYRNLADEAKLYRLNLKTAEEQMVLPLSVRTYSLSGDSLFYVPREGGLPLWEKNLRTGEEKQVLPTRTEALISSSHYLFYINGDAGNRLYLYDREEGLEKEVLPQENINSIYLSSEGKLYFDAWGLRELNLETGEVKVLTDFSASRLSLLGKGIFCSNENVDRYKYYVPLDGGPVTQLSP